jgi:hypothetical protein
MTYPPTTQVRERIPFFPSLTGKVTHAYGYFQGLIVGIPMDQAYYDWFYDVEWENGVVSRAIPQEELVGV